MVGDIYITKLERGFFGAIRILKSDISIGFLGSKYAYLVQICNYADKLPPKIDDVRLLQPLVQSRFHHEGTLCVGYFSGTTQRENFIYLGNIPLTSSECEFVYRLETDKKADFDYKGVFNERTGWEAFMEWRWKNERLELLNEEIINRQIATAQLNERKKEQELLVSDDTYWKIFLLFDWKAKGEQEIIEPVIRYLTSLSVYDIRRFADFIAEKLFYLDTKLHAENMGKNSYSDDKKIFSPEAFLYKRCLVLAKGKIIYEEIRKDPSKMPQGGEFPALLDIVPHAYYRKIGKPFIYNTIFNYETFSNRNGWDIPDYKESETIE